VLDAYIRKFMRPAAGAETLGDLERGMAALGRKGELPEGSPATSPAMMTRSPSLQRGRDQAESEALELAPRREVSDSRRRDGLGRAPRQRRLADPQARAVLAATATGSKRSWLLPFAGPVRPFQYRRGGRKRRAGARGARGPPELAPKRRSEALSAPGASDEITVESYVDAYLRGEGRGDSPRDRELLQFATNNGAGDRG
jgi:hypothetical protein